MQCPQGSSGNVKLSPTHHGSHCRGARHDNAQTPLFPLKPKKREAKLRRCPNARLGERSFRRNATHALWSSRRGAGRQVQLHTYLGHHSQLLFTTSSLIREHNNSRRRKKNCLVTHFRVALNLNSRLYFPEVTARSQEMPQWRAVQTTWGLFMFKCPTLRHRCGFFSFGRSLSSKLLLKSPLWSLK